MVTEAQSTIPDLAKFSAQEYSAGGISVCRAYINTILRAHQVQLPERVLGSIDRQEERMLVGNFFRGFPYGPDTALGQLVQMIACEVTHEVNIRNGLRTHQKWAIEASRTSLPTLRKVKQEIAEEIFSQESTEYKNRLSTVFFAHRLRQLFPMRGKNDQQRRQERNGMLASLVAEISTRFPLTSR